MNFFFSIIIPSYNQSAFLGNTLESVFYQTFKSWECVIVDDGSTDQSVDIASKWVTKDERFKLYKKENGGLSSTRNFGLLKAKGQYIQFLDADDLLHPEKLEEAAWEHNKGHDIVVTSFNVLQNRRILVPYCNLTQENLTFEKILMEWDKDFTIPIHCGTFSRRIIGDTIFSEHIHAGEDWVFWLMLFKKQPNTQFLQKELASYRFHSRSMTRNPTYMTENKHRAQQFIYDMLDDEEVKKNFFSRFSLEALQRREELTYIYMKKDKKLTRRIRNGLRELRHNLGLSKRSK